jgi:hypothetical protein
MHSCLARSWWVLLHMNQGRCSNHCGCLSQHSEPPAALMPSCRCVRVGSATHLLPACLWGLGPCQRRIPSTVCLPQTCPLGAHHVGRSGRVAHQSGPCHSPLERGLQVPSQDAASAGQAAGHDQHQSVSEPVAALSIEGGCCDIDTSARAAVAAAVPPTLRGSTVGACLV